LLLLDRDFNAFPVAAGVMTMGAAPAFSPGVGKFGGVRAEFPVKTRDGAQTRGGARQEGVRPRS